MHYLALLPLILGLSFSAPAMAQSAAKCVDVESASAKDLEALKGIGPALSKRIIDYRKIERTKATKEGRKTWNFQNWATLMKVDGVAQQVCTDNVATVCFSGKLQKACPAPK
jgi:DNA uptake protein ComE-like DNA-binding protein